MQRAKDLRAGYKSVVSPRGKNENIPLDWNLTDLKKIGSLKDGDWILERDYADFGVRLLQISDIGIGRFIDKSKRYISVDAAKKLKCTLINQGKDILVSRMPEPIGRACLSPVLPYPYIVAVDISIYSVDDKIADRKFLIHSLNNRFYFNQVLQYVSGTTRQRISRKKLEEIKVFLPPFKEQQKIVSILSKVDALVQITDQIIEQTQRLKKGIMQELLTKGLRHSEFKEERIPFMSIKKKIPMSWKVVKINEISKVVRGGSPRPAGDPKYFGGDIPWITVGELTKDDHVYVDSVASGLTKLGKERSRFLERGTVVLANSGATLGVPKILNLPGCINDGVAAFLSLDTRLIPEFLYYTLYSLTRILRDVNQGIGQPNLNTEIIGNLHIAVPEVKEQKKIISIISAVHSKIQKWEKYKFLLENLKKALMQNILTGNLRVKV